MSPSIFPFFLLCVFLLLRSSHQYVHGGNGPVTHPTCSPKVTNCVKTNLVRSIDGSCNNLQYSHYGSAGINLLRLVPASYRDGVEEIRLAVSKKPLPNARIISNLFSEPYDRKSPIISHMHVMWGQFVAHDLSNTPIIKTINSVKVECSCTNPHPACKNIILPFDDIQRVKGHKTCLTFKSSERPPTENCRYKVKEQFNSATAFLDGSVVYASNDEALSNIKKFGSGLLSVHNSSALHHHALLPTTEQIKNTTLTNSTMCRKDSSCFVSGEPRANENPALLSFHTIWVRYHNILVEKIQSINPHWKSERLFEEARKIVGALIQMITYRDFLPHLIGKKWMQRFDLSPITSGYWYGYDSTYNPSIINAFATAAFRYGHSQVTSSFSRMNSYFMNDQEAVNTKNLFTFDPMNNNSTVGGFGTILRGLMMDDALKVDTAMTEGLRNHLLKVKGHLFGSDLMAMNIQRGRDHGLPGYNRYRTLCGLKKAKDFADLVTEIHQKKLSVLKTLYESIDDVDLFVGGLAENSVESGLVGPTFACIIAHQFNALKRGDRFWHENKMKSGFTIGQLESLRKISLSRIICDTSEDMKYAMSHPMLLATDKRNQIVSCDEIHHLNLMPWTESTFNQSNIVSSTIDSVTLSISITNQSDSSMRNSNRSRDNILSRNWESDDVTVTQWTAWFPTSEHTSVLNVSRVIDDLKERRYNEICDDVIRYDVRKVSNVSSVQIRFECPIGSITATDFPAVTEDFYWTKWKTTRTLTSNEGYILERKDIKCQDIISLQAKTTNGTFAIESGQVFAEYSPNRGFLCRHRDQDQYRSCMKYQVRALCRSTSSDVENESNKHLLLTKLVSQLCSVFKICATY